VTDRRAFLAYTVACAAIASGRANAQQSAKLPRVGLVFNSIPLAALPNHSLDRAFVAGLRAAGWVEGRNIIVERRSAEGDYDRLPRLMQELLALPVDVIVAIGPAVFAACRATQMVPIVAVATDGLVEDGAAESLARPGHNVTGLTGDVGPTDMNHKRLQLLKEVAPQASRVAILVSLGQVREPSLRPSIEAAARTLGQTVVWAGANAPGDFQQAFAEIAKQRADALFVDSTPVNYVHTDRITAFASQRRIPAVYAFRGGPEAGGLMSFASDYADLYRRAASYVDRILRGAKPGDLPIEQPTKVELVVNLKAAKAIGITIPQSLLLRADEVIQ
jgi:putative ABC transport system substrate-binding protein